METAISGTGGAGSTGVPPRDNETLTILGNEAHSEIVDLGVDAEMLKKRIAAVEGRLYNVEAALKAHGIDIPDAWIHCQESASSKEYSSDPTT